ncbi:prepilin peptidase [Micromonospora echinofusca]|uniref:Prepilin peptidase n=1 Tax=Micromonospora echinofusca TaxID=47858 RepID=A0ABS3VNU0_MICEH|nr:prepilin peptidase [Micromonospora echinofusca]MBO4206230.1 prepilin peptidase [Micromonospora echinofusca]
MSPLVTGTAALACAAAGLLVPTVAHRLSVAYGEPARSTCAACAGPLPGGVPGWLAARCGGCAARLGPPRWSTALAAGLAGGLLGATLGPVTELPLFLAVAVLGVLLGAIDLACRRLPDPLVLPALAVTPVLLAAVAAGTGQWDDWLRGLLACLTLGLVFTAMALLPGGGFGLGDAKVGALLGWYLGWLGWGTVLLGAVLPWVLNVPLLLFLLVTGRAGWKTKVPFGPALLTGALLAVPAARWWPTIG